MRFRELDPGWQAAFALAWEAYIDGTVPIGAAILDSAGQIVSTGRNRIYASSAPPPQLYGNRLAHAEINAILRLLENEPADIRACTLYTTMEPCPLCFGAIVMGNLRHFRYAARDRIGGTVAFNGANDFIRSKNIRADGPFDGMEAVQIVWHSCFSLLKSSAQTAERLLSAWTIDCPGGVVLGRSLHASGELAEMSAHQTGVEVAYDFTLERLESLE